jgi:hypothetical protein
MKKGIALMISAIMALAIAGCSNKKNDTTQTPASDNAPAATEETIGTALENASKEVDMDKIDGKELNDVDTENDEAVLGRYEVSVDEAKVIDYNGEKVVIVSFDFENNTSDQIAFDGAMSVKVTQNDSELRGTVVTGVKGVNINSSFEPVKSGRDITLQRAYVIEDETAPINVAVYKYGEEGGAAATKTFNLQ